MYKHAHHQMDTQQACNGERIEGFEKMMRLNIDAKILITILIFISWCCLTSNLIVKN